MKKTTLYAALLALSVIACAEDKKKEIPVDAIGTMQNEQHAMMEALKKFGSDYASAWSGKDPSAVASFFSADGSLKVNNNEPAIGREAITGVAKSFMDAFPDMVVRMDSLVETQDGLQFHWTLTGTNTGPEGTGSHVKISGFEIWQLNAEGLVQKSTGSFNEEEYQRQLQGGMAVGP